MFARFGIFLASVGYVTPHIGAEFSAFFKRRALYLENVRAFYEKSLVQLGSVLPNTSAVHFCYWCAIFECGGRSLMFVCAFWYVFGFGGACYSPCWC